MDTMKGDVDDGPPQRWRVLVDHHRAAVTESAELRLFAPEDVAGAFPYAPEALLEVDGPIVLQVLEPSPDGADLRWAALDVATGPEVVLAAVRDAIRKHHGTDA